MVKKKTCYFCRKRKEHTQVIENKRLISICFLCNKRGVHFRNNWEIQLEDGWKYLFYEDKFIKNDKLEISRLMLHLIS